MTLFSPTGSKAPIVFGISEKRKEGKEFRLVDAEAASQCTRYLIIGPLLSELTKITGKNVDHQDLPLSHLTMSGSPRHTRFQAFGKHWLFEPENSLLSRRLMPNRYPCIRLTGKKPSTSHGAQLMAPRPNNVAKSGLSPWMAPQITVMLVLRCLHRGPPEYKRYGRQIPDVSSRFSLILGTCAIPLRWLSMFRSDGSLHPRLHPMILRINSGLSLETDTLSATN